MKKLTFTAALSLSVVLASAQNTRLPEAIPVTYGTESTADLGVGLWGIPIPWDVDGDGLKDLVVTCPDTPYKGTYFFRNIGTKSAPLFDRAVKLNAKSHKNLRFSEVDGKCYLLVPDAEEVNFFKDPFKKKKNISYAGEVLGADYKRSRSNMWNKVDWDGDGDLDIIVGIDTWDDYGWDNAFNDKGEWTKGPLHGYVYLLENVDGSYINRGKLSAGGKTIDTFGAPCPCVADFDGDGDLDLICGEFRDGLTWYENVGSRRKPRFKAPRQLANSEGDIRFHIEMIVPVPTDFDEDGLVDLIVSDEDGSVSFVRNTGKVKGHMPVFENPVKFRQKADLVKFGALCTPCAVDWNGDGKTDIISGNSAGDIAFIENLSGGAVPTWAEPRLIRAGGKPFRVMAGYNGSIQGPAELKWGYTVLSVADWDGDGLKDIIYNSIWGKIEWLKNLGEADGLGFAEPQPLLVDWSGEAPKPSWNWWNPEPGTFTSQWRTTPVAIDWNSDGLMDIVMLDHEGYLAFFERFKTEDGHLMLKPGKRIFHCTNGSIYRNRQGMIDQNPGLLRLNEQIAGSSGRRKICFTDWDCDGSLDLIIDGTNAAWFRCVSKNRKTGDCYYEYMGDLSSTRLEGHTTCPTPVDWDADGVPDLLVGAEDGHFYLIKNVLSNYDERIPLYGKDVMPKEEHIDSRGYISGKIEPELLVYRPTSPNGNAMIVVPGGGYEKNCITREGYHTAKWLSENGITAFVLKYRLPEGRPETVLEDGEKAMEYVRTHATQYGVDPHRIGVIGFSAGGHFCSTLLTKYRSIATRPDFGVLVYPVVEMGDNTHPGTRMQLLGDRENDTDLRKQWNASMNIPAGMPPVMIITCDDDKAVPPVNSTGLYDAMRKAGITAELHIFPEGGHGFWFRDRFKYMKETLELISDWIGRMENPWETMPLSPASDKKQLAAQIAANPEEWAAAARFLQENDLASLPLGRCEITTSGTYANVQEYATKKSSRYEAHRRYADVQVLISGKEDIMVADIKDAGRCTAKYNEQKDIEFYTGARNAKPVFASPENWVVLFPNETHEPCMAREGKPSVVRKVVVKVKIAE